MDQAQRDRRLGEGRWNTTYGLLKIAILLLFIYFWKLLQGT